MAFTVQRHIDWGDCDAAGIVFYPNYFRWMDSAFHQVCAAAGYDQRALREQFGVLGTPLIAAQASFQAPGTYGDSLAVDVRVEDWGRSSFRVTYSIMRDTMVLVIGTEKRVFVETGNAGTLKACPIPDEFRRKIEELVGE